MKKFSFKKEFNAGLEKLLARLDSGVSPLVIDADVHISTISPKELAKRGNYYHGQPLSCEQLLSDMQVVAVDCALCWQNPATTHYRHNDYSYNYEQLYAANCYIASSFISHPLHLVPAAWLDPRALGLSAAKRMVDELSELGFFIFKMNPGQNAYPIDDPLVFELSAYVAEKKAIIAFHYGADTPYTPATGLEKILQHIAPAPLLAVHAGGGGASFLDAENLYQQTRQLIKKYDNLFLIESAKRSRHIESDIIDFAIAGSSVWERVFVGSDNPYISAVYFFAGLRALFESIVQGKNSDPRLQPHNPVTRDLVQGWLGQNFANFILQFCKQHRPHLMKNSEKKEILL